MPQIKQNAPIRLVSVREKEIAFLKGDGGELVTIGICAFNEGGNIEALLRRIMNQKMHFPKEIIVVSDGSTDSTSPIVQKLAGENPNVKLICHPTRKGKSEALNTLIGESAGKILLVVGADTLLYDGSIQNVVEAFDNLSVGMCWSRLVPLNDEANFVNRLGHFAFRLHHRLSLKLDASGEMRHATGDILALRREAISKVPVECVNDDEYLAAETVRRGFKVAYLPRILYRTAMPTTIIDYVNQRRRWVYGHIEIRKLTGEFPTVLEFLPTRNPGFVLSTVLEEIAENPRAVPLFLASLFLELAVGMLVMKDLMLRVSHSPWRVIGSTKRRN